MAVRKIKNSWWVDFRAGYTRYRLRSPQNTKAGAEAYEAVLRQRLARGEPIGKEAAGPQVLFKDFAQQWYRDYVVPNNKAGEQENKKRLLDVCLIPFFGNMPVKAITTQHVEQYKAHLLKKGLSPKTVNNRLNILGKYFVVAYDWLKLPGLPPKITRLKYSPPSIDYLSLDEYSLLLSNSTDVLHEMLLVAMRTGMRRGELIGLQWSSIDWKAQSITVRHSQCEYSGKLGSTKSNRERHIPMDADVYTALFNRKRDTGYVFVDGHGRHFSGKQLASRLEKLRRQVGLRKIGWHTLRHTFASHLVANRVELPSVQKLMGHSSIVTTMRYVHLAPSMLREAINTLNPKTAPTGNFGQPVGNRWTEAVRHDAKNT